MNDECDFATITRAQGSSTIALTHWNQQTKIALTAIARSKKGAFVTSHDPP
jgi:hypothetical protein